MISLLMSNIALLLLQVSNLLLGLRILKLGGATIEYDEVFWAHGVYNSCDGISIR